MRLPPPILGLSPGGLRSLRSPEAGELLARLRQAVTEGLEGVLLREPLLPDAELLQLAVAVRGVVGDGWLGLHDRLHLAACAGADGLHLGWRSLPPAEARRLLDPTIAVGFSAHAGDAEGAREGADYLFMSPVRPVPGKGPALGWEGLEEEVRGEARPVWALGGLAPEDLTACRSAGCQGLVARRSILGGRQAGAPGP